MKSVRDPKRMQILFLKNASGQPHVAPDGHRGVRLLFITFIFVIQTYPPSSVLI